MAAEQTAPRDGRGARWDEHRSARRRELIDATIAAVREIGPWAGIGDIARHAGVSKPVFYRYFTDKGDLHHAVGNVVADAVVARVNRAIDETQGTVRDRVAAGMDCYLRVIEAEPGLYAYVVHAAPPRRAAGTSDPVEDWASVVGIHASQVIGAVLREAGADTGAAEPWGFGVVGMVRSAADRWLDHPTMSREDLVGYLADLVTPGLLAALDRDTGAT